MLELKSKKNHSNWKSRWSIKADESSLKANIPIKKTYILPNLKGCYLAITIIIMFIWSTNYGLSLGLFFTFFLVCLFVVMSVLTVGNLSGLTVGYQNPNQLFASCPAHCLLSVSTLKNNPSFALLIKIDGEKEDALCEKVAFNKPQQVAVPITRLRRGYQPLGLIKLSTHYPMNIFNVWTWINFSDFQILVFPEPKNLLPLPQNLSVTENNRSSIHMNLGDESFSGLKDYQQGENIRRIHWRKSYQDNLFVKQFENSMAGSQYSFDYDDPLLLNLNQENRLSQLCYWILKADEKNYRYALKLPNQLIDLNQGESHKLICLKALACF